MVRWYLLHQKHWQLPHKIHTADPSWDRSFSASYLQNENKHVGSGEEYPNKKWQDNNVLLYCIHANYRLRNSEEPRINAVSSLLALPYPSVYILLWCVHCILFQNRLWELLSYRKNIHCISSWYKPKLFCTTRWEVLVCTWWIIDSYSPNTFRSLFISLVFLYLPCISEFLPA